MIVESRDAMFFEDVFLYKQEEDKTSGKRIHEIAFRDEVNVETEPRRNMRSRISKSFGLNFIAYTLASEPRAYKEAISTCNAPIPRIRGRHCNVYT